MQCTRLLLSAIAIAAGIFPPALTYASSHMDAPLISLDDAANTTDVYAFVSRRPSSSQKYLTVGLAVYPFEEPGIGPNNYRFDPAVTYSIHVALGNNAARGVADLTYKFRFQTAFANQNTTLQSYLGVLAPAGSGRFPANQNLRQTYSVTKVAGSFAGATGTLLGSGLIVPPNNQGRVTPFYNQGNDGDRPAKPGVGSEAALDPYTRQSIATLQRNYRSFAGQRDDGFYADIQSIFDLDFTFGADRSTPTKPFDSQGGYNVHTIVLEIPFAELNGAKIAGVYATTSRNGVQVGRQGNPLFNEAFVALRDKDRYNARAPGGDALFRGYARNPELSRVLGATPLIPGLLESIFIPDLIKVDLTTTPARLAGQAGFNRLSVFGNDVLKSTFQDPFNNGGFIPGGWPNGRRFGDDVIDIGIIALGIAGTGPDFSGVDIDRVAANDITYNDVFPYAATPLNGRVHEHHGDTLP
jgi:hypothetical protein